MRITVTEEHIRKGKTSDACACPVALAMKEALKRDLRVYEKYVHFPIVQGRRPESSPLPPEVTTFIVRFDNNAPVQPLSFDLPLDESAEHPQVDESH